MANTDDAKPFVVLKEDAEDFKKKFDEDIIKCMRFLDLKITDLICDPDSVGKAEMKYHAQVEFSKAKYDIFMSTSSLMAELEKEWTHQIRELKDRFMENVEIFLAGTKLEVKLPSNKETSGRQNIMKTPKGKKGSSSPSSMYPLLNSLTKNIPSLKIPQLRILKINPEENETSSNDSSEDEVPVKQKREVRRIVAGENLGKSPVIKTPVRKTPVKIIKELDIDVSEEPDFTTELYTPRVRENRRRTRGPAELNQSIKSTPGKSLRASARKAVVHEVERNEDSSPSKLNRSTVGQTPKRVTFSDDDNNWDDSAMPSTSKNVAVEEEDDDPLMEIFTPVRSKPRRKTIMIEARYKDMSDVDLTPDGALIPARRSKSKRKTIGSVSDISSDLSPKRLKGSGSAGVASTSGWKDDKSNLLASDDSDITDNYTDWMPLKTIDGKIPTKPAVYELKVWRAKKSAFIGCCDNLRQKLTLHKLGQNSGHKHLDKFLERNPDDIHVRYELMSSIDVAKVELKNRINNFVSQFKTTPAYN